MYKNGRKGSGILAVLLSVIIAGSSLPVYAASEENVQKSSYPFIIENTEYGVKNELVTAKKLVITDGNAKVYPEIERRNGIKFVNYRSEEGKYYAYLIGINGCAAEYKLTENEADPVVKAFSCYQSPKKDILRLMYKIQDPVSLKWDLYNASTGEFYPYQMDKISSIGGRAVILEKDGMQGLAAPDGKLLYEPAYESISYYLTTDKGIDVFLGDKKVADDYSTHTEYAVLTSNGSTDGNIFYYSMVSGVQKQDGSTVLPVGQEDSDGHTKYGFLSLDSGDLSELKYDEILCNGKYFLGEYKVNGLMGDTKCDVVSDDGIWDINSKFGGTIGSAWFLDGFISIGVGNRNSDNSYVSIFSGIIDGKGNVLYDRAALEERCGIRGFYGNLMLVERNDDVRSCFLQTTKGEHVIDDDISDIRSVGNYLLVEMEGGRSVILDPESKEILIDPVTCSEGDTALSPGYLSTDCIMLYDSKGGSKFGIFNGSTGAFSGYVFDRPAGCDNFSSKKYTDGERIIWEISFDDAGYNMHINDSLEILDAQEKSKGEWLGADKDMNAAFSDMTNNKVRIVDYHGKLITEFPVRSSDLIEKLSFSDETRQTFRSYDENGGTGLLGTYGLVRGDGTQLLESIYGYIGATDNGLTAVYSKKWPEEPGQAGVVNMDGDYLVQAEFGAAPGPDEGEASTLGGVIDFYNPNDEAYYFYDFNQYLDQSSQEKLAVKETFPVNGDTVKTPVTDIRITFNQDVNIFNDIKVGEGNIQVVDAETKEAVLNYNMITGAKGSCVRYRTSKEKSTIVLENALTYLEDGKRYYVLMDDRCVTAYGRKNVWFEGLHSEEEFSFIMGEEAMPSGNLPLLAAVSLSQRMPDTVMAEGKGKTVSTILATDTLKNEKIWKNRGYSYNQFYRKVFGAYQLAESSPADSSCTGVDIYIYPETARAVVVLTVLPVNRDIDSLNLNQDYFSKSYTKYTEAVEQYSDYDITVTGEGAAGAVAAYISAIDAVHTVTFNAPIKTGLDLAYLFNADVILKYQGTAKIPCVNYSNRMINGLQNGGYHNIKLAHNKYGSSNSLNGLFEYGENGLALTEQISETQQTDYITGVFHTWDDIEKNLKPFFKGEYLKAVTAVFTEGTGLCLGKSDSDYWKPWSPIRSQVEYSGTSGNRPDVFYGSDTAANMFNFSGGEAEFHGGWNRDEYYINGPGTVSICDKSSAFYRGAAYLKSFELAEKFDLKQLPKYAKLAKKFIEVADGRALDTIYVNTAQVSESQVTLQDGKYIIETGDCTIQVEQQYSSPILVAGLDGTKVYLQPEAAEEVNAIQEDGNKEFLAAGSETDYSLRNLLLTGTGMQIRVNSRDAAEDYDVGTEAEGEFARLSVQEGGNQSMLSVGDGVESIEILGGVLEAIEAPSMEDTSVLYNFAGAGSTDADVFIDLNAGTVTDTKEGKLLEPVAQTVEPAAEEPLLTGLNLAAPNVVDYEVGEELRTTGIEVYACYSDGNTIKLNENDYTVSGFDSTTEGPRQIQVEYQDQSNIFEVMIHPAGELISDIKGETEIQMQAGEAKALNIQTVPADAEEESLLFTSDNEEVILTKGSYVYALKEGTAQVAVRDMYGRTEAVCRITVTQPADPDNPDKPDNPDEPDNPGKPDNPDGPDNPGKPDNPDGPDNPDKPDNPDGPDNPDKPDNPDGPDNPDNPDGPDNPGKPDNPDGPDNPGKPDDPEKPEKCTHQYKTTIKKATTKTDGSIVTECILCGNVDHIQKISRIKRISLSKSSYVHDGERKTPSVTVRGNDGKIIRRSNYSLAWASGRKDVGSYTVKITFKGNYKGTAERTFSIKPKGTSLKKIKAKKKSFVVTWKEQKKQTTGYELQYALKSNLKRGKIVPAGKNKNVSKVVKGVRAKKRYYVRIRTYKNVKGKKICSRWSKVKKVVTK